MGAISAFALAMLFTNYSKPHALKICTNINSHDRKKDVLTYMTMNRAPQKF